MSDEKKSSRIAAAIAGYFKDDAGVRTDRVVGAGLMGAGVATAVALDPVAGLGMVAVGAAVGHGTRPVLHWLKTSEEAAAVAARKKTARLLGKMLGRSVSETDSRVPGLALEALEAYRELMLEASGLAAGHRTQTTQGAFNTLRGQKTLQEQAVLDLGEALASAA